MGSQLHSHIHTTHIAKQSLFMSTPDIVICFNRSLVQRHPITFIAFTRLFLSYHWCFCCSMFVSFRFSRTVNLSNPFTLFRHLIWFDAIWFDSSNATINHGFSEVLVTGVECQKWIKTLSILQFGRSHYTSGIQIKRLIGCNLFAVELEIRILFHRL